MKVAEDAQRVRIRDEVEHGAVAARVEDGVKVRGAVGKVRELLRLLPVGRVVLEEVFTDGVVPGHVDRSLVEGCLAALRGSKGEVGLAAEDVERVSELGLKTRLVSCDRGKNRPESSIGFLTKYQPMGLPFLGTLSAEVRTTRILGLEAAIVLC